MGMHTSKCKLTACDSGNNPETGHHQHAKLLNKKAEIVLNLTLVLCSDTQSEFHAEHASNVPVCNR